MKKKPFMLNTIAFIMIISGLLGIFNGVILRTYYHLLTFRSVVSLEQMVTYSMITSTLFILVGVGLLINIKWSRYVFIGLMIIHNTFKFSVVGFDVVNLPLLLLEFVVVAMLFIGPINDYLEGDNNGILDEKAENKESIERKKVTLFKIVLILIGTVIVSVASLLQVGVITMSGAVTFMGLEFTETIFIRIGLAFVVLTLIGIMMLTSLLISRKKLLLTWSITFGIQSSFLFLVSVIWSIFLYSNVFSQLIRNDFKDFFISSIPNTLVLSGLYFILSTVCYRIYKNRKGAL